MMNKFDSEKTTVFLCGIIFIALAISYYFLFTSIQTRNQSISSKNHQAELDLKRVALLQSVKSAVSSTNSDIQKLDAFLIARDGVADFIQSIEDFARGDNLSITVDSASVEPQAVGTTSAKSTSMGEQAEKVNLTVSVTGNWASVFHFLTQIENLPYKTKVASVDLTYVVFDDGSNDKKVASSAWKGKFIFSTVKIK